MLFLEIDVVDPSEFSDVLRVRRRRGGRLPGPAGAEPGRAERDRRRSCSPCATRPACGPHCYFEWSEGSPLVHLMRYLILGRGDTAPVVREIIRKTEPDPARRPGIHVG